MPRTTTALALAAALLSAAAPASCAAPTTACTPSPGRPTAASSRRAATTTLAVWEAASGQLRAHFRGHRGGVTAVAFTADSRAVISGSEDGTALVWDVAWHPDAPQAPRART